MHYSQRPFSLRTREFVLPRVVLPFVVSLLLPLLAAPAPAQDRVAVASPMDASDALDFRSGAPEVVSQGPEGTSVLRFDDRFEGSIDLSKRGINPEAYDLMKIQIKADRGAQLQLTLSNHPNSGDASHWWVLDGLRGPLGWRTIWVDLNVPETIKEAEDERESWRKGAETTGSVLSIQGFVKNLGRRAAADAESIWIGDIRFVQQSVALDWNQADVSQAGGEDRPLVYSYPLQVTNKRDRSLTAQLALQPVDTTHARAEVPGSVSLDAGESKTVTATITLPEDVVARKPPLYTERFQAVARAEGIDDSEVTILRSSDPIHLVATVPLSAEQLQFPLYPPPSTLPNDILFFDEQAARRMAERQSPEALIQQALKNGIYNYSEDVDASAFRKALVSSAYLYDLHGTEKHLRIAETLLQALPQIWDKHYEEWTRQPVRQIASGIVVRWREDFHYTLGLGWRLAGTQRSPYQYSRDANAANGGMSAIIYAFDMLASDLTLTTRRAFIHEFLVPAGIQSRNHYIGDGNQQATVNAVTLYAGLAARNWPLAAFAYNAEHGVKGVLKWTFTDEGVHIRDGYQTYALRPIFWSAELLHGVGIPFYERHEERLREVVGAGFDDRTFWTFVERHRLDPE